MSQVYTIPALLPSMKRLALAEISRPWVLPSHMANCNRNNILFFFLKEQLSYKKKEDKVITLMLCKRKQDSNY